MPVTAVPDHHTHAPTGDPTAPVPALLDLIADAAAATVQALVTYWMLTLPGLALAAITLLAARRTLLRRRHGRLTADARQVIVLAPPSVDPAGGEALWANLVGLTRPAWRRLLTGQPHLVWEYVFTPTGVTIQIWVPGTVPPGLVERAVEAAWPGAHTRTAPARPPLPAPARERHRVITGGELRLARPEALPLRTRFDADPVRGLVGAAVGLGSGVSRDEYGCVQILARPVTGRRVARARRSARHLSGDGAAGPLPRFVTSLLATLLDWLTPGPVVSRQRTRSTSPAAPRDPRESADLSAQRRAAVDKQRGSQYETVVRYAATIDLPARHEASTGPDATEGQRSRIARDTARGLAHALAASFASYTELNRYTRHRLRHPATALATRRLEHGDVLSIRELAAIAHLPTDDNVPGLLRAGARAVAPPPGVAEPGRAAKPLGVTDAGHARPVGLRVPDARHHLHVIGATGSGKSTLLGNMILADVDAGRGLVLVDPKGDLVTDVLARLSRSAAGRVVLLDAGSRGTTPCLNPLDLGSFGKPADADLAVDNLVSVFRRVYSAFWGPRTDDIMRAACLTLCAQPTGAGAVPTLAQLPGLLAEPATRDRLTAAVTDPVLRGFWSWFDDLSDPGRAQVVAPLLNKLRAFLLRPFVRNAIAGGPSTVDMSAVLDGGICLVRIPKGSLGEETTRLVGSLVVAEAWQATTARAHSPQPDRRDASIVVDECHNFLNLPYPIEDMLAEARGFRVAMTLAHQHLGQLPRELREGLSTNARSKIFFSAGPEDARDLARHTAPQLTDHDLAHLGAFHAAARLVLHGEQAPAFTLRTLPLPPPVPGRSREIRAAARRATSERATARAETAAVSAGKGRETPDPRAARGRPPGPAVDPRRRA